MGLFDFFKKKPAQPVGQVIVPIPVEREQSSKPVQIDEYVQERGRILSILSDQAMQFPDSRAAISLAYFLKLTTEQNSDYAHTTLVGCCDKCAPYRNRYYSISGKDKRLPKVPDFFLDIKNWEHCHVVLQPVYDIDILIEVKGNQVVNESNRPFIDDRSAEERENYQNYLAEKQAEAEKAQDKEDYEILSALYPDIVPKSFGAYRRLRNSNPGKFEEIRQLLDKE